MTLKLYPTVFEIVDDAPQELLAKVTQLDEGAVEIEIKSLIGFTAWTDLAALISEARRQMELEE